MRCICRRQDQELDHRQQDREQDRLNNGHARRLLQNRRASLLNRNRLHVATLQAICDLLDSRTRIRLCCIPGILRLDGLVAWNLSCHCLPVRNKTLEGTQDRHDDANIARRLHIAPSQQVGDRRLVLRCIRRNRRRHPDEASVLRCITNHHATNGRIDLSIGRCGHFVLGAGI